MIYARRTDFTANDAIIYKGEAIVGALNAAPVWRVRRLTIGTDGDTTEEWADGAAAFAHVWDDRLTLAYS